MMGILLFLDNKILQAGLKILCNTGNLCYNNRVKMYF